MPNKKTARETAETAPDFAGFVDGPQPAQPTDPFQQNLHPLHMYGDLDALERDAVDGLLLLSQSTPAAQAASTQGFMQTRPSRTGSAQAGPSRSQAAQAAAVQAANPPVPSAARCWRQQQQQQHIIAEPSQVSHMQAVGGQVANPLVPLVAPRWRQQQQIAGPSEATQAAAIQAVNLPVPSVAAPPPPHRYQAYTPREIARIMSIDHIMNLPPVRSLVQQEPEQQPSQRPGPSQTEQVGQDGQATDLPARQNRPNSNSDRSE